VVRCLPLLPVLFLLLSGCGTAPSDRAWNRPTKAEVSATWLRVGNPEIDEHRQQNPYP
jgi:hypothetical protein